MSEELKPCPHCGGDARTRTTRKMNSDKDMRYYVECKECYSSSNPWYDLGAKDTKADAITAWNTRHPDKELVEALEDADEVICSLCKRLNPQHKNCVTCNSREVILATLSKYKE